MEDDKNPEPAITDEGQADNSTATATTTDVDLNVANQRDPRLMVDAPDEPATEPAPPADPPAPADEPPAAPSEPPADPVEPPTPVPAEPPADTPPVTSHRENRRIAELTRKLQESNYARQAQPSQPQQPSQIIGEGDYSTEQINTLAQQHGDQRYLEGVRQASDSTLFATRLEIDAPKVEANYPQLNPRSDQFDPGLADYTTEMFKKMVGMKVRPDGTYSVENNNIRYTDVVDGLMDAVESLAASRQADSTTNLAKQASRTGVRPSNVVAKPYQGTNPKLMPLDQLRQMANKEVGLA